MVQIAPQPGRVFCQGRTALILASSSQKKWHSLIPLIIVTTRERETHLERNYLIGNILFVLWYNSYNTCFPKENKVLLLRANSDHLQITYGLSADFSVEYIPLKYYLLYVKLYAILGGDSWFKATNLKKREIQDLQSKFT